MNTTNIKVPVSFYKNEDNKEQIIDISETPTNKTKKKTEKVKIQTSFFDKLIKVHQSIKAVLWIFFMIFAVIVIISIIRVYYVIYNDVVMVVNDIQNIVNSIASSVEDEAGKIDQIMSSIFNGIHIRDKYDF